MVIFLTYNFPGGSDGKASAYNAGDPGLIPGLGRSPGERNGNPLQYSCLENPMDGGAWLATVQGVAKSWTRLSDFTITISITKSESPTVGLGNLHLKLSPGDSWDHSLMLYLQLAEPSICQPLS